MSLSQQVSDWRWDSNSHMWYYPDSRTGHDIFENGTTRLATQQPRSIPISSQAGAAVSRLSSGLRAQPSAYYLRREQVAQRPENPRVGSAQPVALPAQHQGQARALQTDQQVDSLATDFQATSMNPSIAPRLQNDTRMWTDSNGERFVNTTNPVNEVQTSLKLGPANRITDPELFQQGIRATQMVLQTQGDAEKLFHAYKRREQPRRFFTQGKVFRVLWSEPVGDNRTSVTFHAPGITAGRYGEPVHSKVRLFVVIREGDTYCSALPILSYNSQGVAKRGITKSEHSIVYTGKIPPQISANEAPQRGEMGMRPDAIRVNPDDRTDQLSSHARIDYGKVYTIEHNIKVKPYGQVHPSSQAALRHQFLNVWLGEPAVAGVAHLSSDNRATKVGATISGAGRQSSQQSTHSTQAATNLGSRRQASSGNAPSVNQSQIEAAVTRMIQRGYSRDQAFRAVQREFSRVVTDSNDSEDDDDEDEEEDDSSTGQSDARTSAQGSSSNRLTGLKPDSMDMERSEQRTIAQGGASSNGSNSSRKKQTQEQFVNQRHGTRSWRPEAGRRADLQDPETSSTHPPHEVRARTEALLQHLIDRGYSREQAIRYARASLTGAGDA